MAGRRKPPGQPGLGPLTCAALDQVTQWRCRERASCLAGEDSRKTVHIQYSFCEKLRLKGLSGRLSAMPHGAPEDCARLEEMLRIISGELMPEVELL